MEWFSWENVKELRQSSNAEDRKEAELIAQDLEAEEAAQYEEL